MMTTFYRTTLPLAPAHLAAFEACHQEAFAGNEVSVMRNVAGTECLVKCSHAEAMELPPGFTYTETLTLEQARTLLGTAAWSHPELPLP